MAGTGTAGVCIGGAVLGSGGGGASSHSSSWGCQMDALVSDLSLALDESQQLQRRRRPFRRRANQQPGKSQGCGASDYSSSSVEEAAQTGGANSQDNKSSMPLTDSDGELSPCPRTPRYRTSRPLRPPRPPPGAGVVESDSVNECFSPAPRPNNIRRKPKCNRLTLEHGGEGSNSLTTRGPRWRAPPVVHRVHSLHTPIARKSSLCGGKRKRSREGGSEGGGEEEEAGLPHHPHHGPMDISVAQAITGVSSTVLGCVRPLSSSTLCGERDEECSSDDSEGGACGGEGGEEGGGSGELFTCDEGREADDEQSDWFTEGPGPVYGVPPTSHQPMSCDEGSSSGLHSSRMRFQKIRERLMRREIRAGRRRLRERRPGYAIGPSSVCETVTRFLQDPLASELQLRPASLAECDQLQRLAQLYSLQLRVGGEEGGSPSLSAPAATVATAQQHAHHNSNNSCFVTKTRHTVCKQPPLHLVCSSNSTAAPHPFTCLSAYSTSSTTSTTTISLSANTVATLTGPVFPCTLTSSSSICTNNVNYSPCCSGTTLSSSATPSFPWGLPTPLSDAGKKRRKTPTPPIYTFNSIGDAAPPVACTPTTALCLNSAGTSTTQAMLPALSHASISSSSALATEFMSTGPIVSCSLDEDAEMDTSATTGVTPGIGDAVYCDEEVEMLAE